MTRNGTKNPPEPIRFVFDSMYGTYNFMKVEGINLLPNQIIYEPTKEQRIKRNSNYCLKNAKGFEPYLFTGLIPIQRNYFLGNHYLNGVKNLTIIWIPPSKSKVIIKYYRDWHFPKPYYSNFSISERIKFCKELIKQERKKYRNSH